MDAFQTIAPKLALLGFLLSACGDVSSAALECQGSELFCDETCVEPQSDRDNCGECGTACEAGDVCGSGSCQSDCPDGQTECDQSCFDTSNDINNCGGCGIACDEGNEECRDGACVVPCSRGLIAPTLDPWGYAWDGNERPLTSHADAEATCLAIGGRLPGATELFRISANETGFVGQSTDTNPLWTGARTSPTQAARLRLSDGLTDTALLETESYYRCTCAPKAPPGFVGSACYGPSGNECLALEVFGGRHNIDSWDRPALTKREAIEDCQRSGGQLADFGQLVAAIASGAEGSNDYLHVADDARDTLSTLLRWQGNQSGTWVSSGNVTHLSRETRHPYRCVGANFLTGTHPNTIPGEFVGRPHGIKGEIADSPISTWAEAHDRCVSRGGHLPTSAEMAQLILDGLPGGSSVPIWTADQAGFDGGTFRATMVSWTDVDAAWFYRQSQGEVAWLRQSESHPHRCIYYPLDPGYAGPAEEDCNGGCTQFSLPGGSRIWFDSVDRPASRPDAAQFDCIANGGQMASERDFTEAIRGGLPNGTNDYLWASDHANGNQKILRWTAVETSFDDLHPGNHTWAGISSNQFYRCMWTNEIR